RNTDDLTVRPCQKVWFGLHGKARRASHRKRSGIKRTNGVVCCVGLVERNALVARIGDGHALRGWLCIASVERAERKCCGRGADSILGGRGHLELRGNACTYAIAARNADDLAVRPCQKVRFGLHGKARRASHGKRSGVKRTNDVACCVGLVERNALVARIGDGHALRGRLRIASVERAERKCCGRGADAISRRC
ncbi:MAG: hypothetical protein RSC68_35175, partial [Acinetobacter sp.]